MLEIGANPVADLTPFPSASFRSPPHLLHLFPSLPHSHCVYDLYSESLSTYSESLSRAHDALVAASTPRSDWPVAVDRWKAKGGDQGAKKVLEDMDPAMKAFLEMEGRLKQTSAAVEVEGAKGT